jgi:hypothetical protein
MDILKDTTLFPHIEGLALKGTEMVVTIRSIIKEKMQGPTGRPVEKNVIVFQETPQTLVLNKTNAKRIIALYGSETNDWPGKRIVLHSETVSAFGEVTEAVRVGKKAPPAVTPAQKAATAARVKASVTAARDLYPEQAPDKSATNGNGNGSNPGTPPEPIDWTQSALDAVNLDGFCYAVYQLNTAAFTDANGVKRAYGKVCGEYHPSHNAVSLAALVVLANALADRVDRDTAVAAANRRFTELLAEGEDEQEPPLPDTAEQESLFEDEPELHGGAAYES